MEWNFGLSNPGQSAYGSLRVTSKLICKYPDHGPSVCRNGFADAAGGIEVGLIGFEFGSSLFWTGELAYLREADPNYGLPVNCYVCGAPHEAFGFARVQDNQAANYFPLCERCRDDADSQTIIVGKFLTAPDLEISGGREATTEQVLAIVEKQDETEH